jgi:hypothetical protein
MQAIVTTYLPPTNTKPGRVKASCERGSKIYSWDHGLNPQAMHRLACQNLLDAFAGLDTYTYGGTVKDHNWAPNGFLTGQISDGRFVHVIDHPLSKE